VKCPNCRKEVKEEDQSVFVVKDYCDTCLKLPEKVKVIKSDINIFFTVLLIKMVVCSFTIMFTTSMELGFVACGLYLFYMVCLTCLFIFDYWIFKNWLYDYRFLKKKEAYDDMSYL